MANRLIGNDCAIGIRIGQFYDGNAPVFSGTATDYRFLARRLSLEETVKETEVSGMGDGAEAYRFSKTKSTVTIDGMASSNNGFTFTQVNTGGTSIIAMVGRYVEVTYKPLSAFALPFYAVGVITEWSGEAADGEAQVEKVKINCNPDFIA